jgi:hypothetical protein
VADVEDRHRSSAVADLVDNPVVANAQPPPFPGDELFAPRGLGFSANERIASLTRS